MPRRLRHFIKTRRRLQSRALATCHAKGMSLLERARKTGRKFLNPVEVKVGAGTFKPTRASRTPLSGGAGEALPVAGGRVAFTVAPRAWTRIALS